MQPNPVWSSSFTTCHIMQRPDDRPPSCSLNHQPEPKRIYGDSISNSFCI